ncbi:unnamed protein product [Albugo candida]|uniref:CTLH domain-containing protein n=1 Tax=Albugo candida TaxID=65357 RepID=A0A024GJ40_9STRA|nr:unnamed protein product [Albugo candida]|eukprot:CCI46527.1 unnamed protein product [Albugo candida]
MKGRTSCRPATLWTEFLLVLLASTVSDQVYSIPISSSNTSANATTRLAFSFTSEFDISSDATFLIGLSSAFTINDANQSTFKVFEDDVPSRMSVVEFISPPVRSSLQCNCSANFQSLKQFVTDALALDNDTISHYIIISQPEDTRSRILNQTKLRFSLSNAQNPPYAMRIASPLGFLAIYNSTLKNQSIDLQSFVPWISILDGLDISPQKIWHPSISMNSTLMGRSASISISFDLSVSDLHQAMIFTFPKTYRLSSDTYRVAVNGAECSWKVKREQLFIEGKLSDKDINVTIDVIQPSMEGPIGSSLRIDTTNSDGLLMDQGFIDLSHIFLSRASILLNRTQISLREGGASSTYSLQLEESSRPTDDTQLRIRIVHRFTFSPNCANYSVQLSPSYVVYSMANWTQITVIDVSVPQDLRIQCVNWNSLHHEIELPSNQTDLWSQPNDIALSLTDTTTPTIRLSTRHLGLLSEQNVSYAIQLLFQPEELLEIEIQSIDRNTQTPLSLLNVQPLIVRFHPNDWRPKSVWIHVANASIDTGTAIILRHSILSAFSDVFFTPQSDVLGYIQPSNSCPQQCPRGTFSIEGQHVCTSCPNKSKCPFPNTKSIACPDGETHNTERDECISCPQGFSCSIFDSDPRPCASGTFSAQRQDECIACPMGTFSLEKQDRCTFCPAGYMCPLTDGSANALCPIGTYTIAGGAVTTCTKCPPGFACPRPSDHEPIPCVPGTFSIGCSAICTPCSSGFACPDSTRNISIACEIGTYSLGAQASCLPCPAGFSCSSVSSQDFIPCPLGTYSLSGNAFCIQCPRGSYCDTPQVVKNCSLGTFSVESSSSCSDCPPGYECPRPQDVPRLCPIGYFSPGGWEACALCRPGYRCSPGSTTSTPIQDECPMGSYCNPSYSLTLCPLGTFGNVTAGQSLTHACHSCLEGYYCDIGSTRNTMRLCPPGYFCPAGTQRSSQYPCPYGTYNPQYGQIDSNACSVCPAGRYCGQATSDPTPCPRGSFCKEGTASSDQYPCPAGTFSDRTGLVQALECSICQVAAYCPEKSPSPTLCPAGTYNPNTGAAAVYECMECPSGWMCPRIGTPMYQQRCALGHYCPKGTVLPLACPAGTYTNRNDLIRMEECTVCPQRHACVSGTGGDATPMQMCALGHYCPNQTAYATQFPCLPGTYTSQTNLASEQECDICPKGMYCVGGKDRIDGNCASGHYCPQGTSSPTEFPCPSGYFTAKTDISHVDECEECPMGTYCPQGSTTPIPCKGGTYAERHKSKDAGPGVWPSCVSCPAGNYCPLSSVRPLPCGVGMFSSANAEKCLPCRPGRFCASNTTSFIQMEMELSSWKPSGFLYGKCLNGTYCPSGTDHEPYAEIDACPMGYVCPKGTPLPIACPAGTFNPLTGQDALEDCIATPEGMYSIAASILPTGICAPGFYCPRGSTTFNQLPCPLGTYLNRTQGASVIDCSICIAGKYCPQASSMPRTCPEGYYCPIGISNPIVCPIGTFSSDIGLKMREECTRCPPGRFCDATALLLPTGACEPGYFCVIGSTTSTPSLVSDTNAGVCPKGFYCVRGTAFPTACPAGTISDSMGLQKEDQCNVCPAGKYCQQSGQTNITGECMEGYYCPPGATRPDAMLVPAGYFTTKGLGVPLPCPLGYYSPMAKTTRCLVCVEGTFCPTIATITPLNCFRGYYCPSQSIWPLPCPMGTFSNSTNLIDSAQCTPCRVGMYCDGIGRTTPTDFWFCAAGFMCSLGSMTPYGKNASVSEMECPKGHFCPLGTAHPLPCPMGTYANTTKLEMETQCTLCEEGAYCATTGLTHVQGSCDAGYFCKRGNVDATPTYGVTNHSVNDAIQIGGNPCPKGFFCPKGTSEPLPCPMGTYANEMGASECAICPAGYVCPKNSITFDAHICPLGYFCPSGTTSMNANPCPRGTYGATEKLQSEAQCTSAPGGTFIDTYASIRPVGLCALGFYCSGGSTSKTPIANTLTGGPCPMGSYCPEGSSRPFTCPAGRYCTSSDIERSLPCQAGFYCVQGAYTPTPTGQSNGFGTIGNVCPQGHYCPENCSHPIPCPPGTYSDITQLQNEEECRPCTPGFICNASGIIRPLHACPEGYFCPGNDAQATLLCPRGAACALGSMSPTMCARGSFNDAKGALKCKECPAGYVCSTEGTIQPEECPRGFYCPANTTRNTLFPCLPGTFGNDTRLIDATSCTKCPEGFYCNGNGQTDAPTGRCANGFYCQLGAKTSMPNDTTGGMCEKGFVCLGGASLPSPTDTITGHACHRGFYCPKGAGQQLACPPGTFNPIEQGECLECPEGMYCVANTHTPKVCPYGSYCPAGTHLPLPCPSGTYGNDTRLSEPSQCTRCTAGNYCVNGRITGTCAAGYVCRKHNSSPFPEESHDEGGACPLGHYCPEGIINPVPCPSTTARLTRYGVKMQDCEPCPDGMDCTDGARTRVCPKGFYCRSGTLPIACPMGTYNNETGKAQRQDCRECNAGRLCNDTGIIDMDSYRCPRGSYCVRGAITSNWCPDGTYGEFDGAERIEECVQCPEGSYCSQGASRPQVCPSSTYCPLGSGQPLPCPLGFYCTYNSWLPLNCPRGYVCPFGSATPIRCQRGFYCPGNSDFPLPCPLGTIGRATPTNGSYSTPLESCEKCPKGTYADTYLQKECTSCERGFICLGGTTSKAPMDVDVDHGYPCPAGYFCPQASHQAIACPAGTYQPKETAGNDSDCLLCPLGTYQMNTAATNCIPCSRSSFTLLPGGVQCKCKGSHRAFQRSDGACTCEPGFQYYENGVFQSDQDSDIDCQPIVYDRCTTSQIRADNGSCVDISMTDCSRVCPKGSGVLLQSAGVCQCEQQSVLDDICDAQCRRESVRLAVNATTKQLQLYDPKAQERIDMENDGMIAKVSCGKDDECPLHTLVLDTFGLAGSYDIPFDMKSKRRRLSTSQKSLLFNPIVCVRSGGGIAFDLRHGISSFGRVSYPMYLKDSMLNTNPHFDYGAFREVAMRIDSNASKVSVFAFTFTDPGMYVFGSSGNSEARTIVSVMQQGTICPVEAPIVPLNEQNLIAIGAVRAADIIVAPDWSLIAGLLVGLFVLLASVIMALYVFHRKRWKTQKCMEGTYRNGNQTDDVVALYADTQSLKDAETYEENRSYWKQSKEMRNGRNAFTKTVENGLLGMRHFLQSELQRIHLGNEMIQWLAAKSFVSLRIAERNEFVRIDTSKNALVSFWKDTAAMDLNEMERYRVKKREMLDRMIQSADNVQKAFGIEGMPRKSDWNVGDLARTLLAESMKGHALDVVEDGSGRESRTMDRGRKALRELKDAMDARSTLSALQMTEEHRQKLTDTVFDAICAKLLESLDDGKECDAMESVKKAYERMQVSRNAMDTQAEAVDAHCTKLIDKMERVFACVESMQTSNAEKETEKRLTFLLRDLLKIKEWERRKSELEAIKDEETHAMNEFQQRLKSFYDVNQQSDKQSIAREGVSLGVSIEKEIKEIRKMLSSLVFKAQVTPREADSLLGDTSWLTETRDALVCMEKSDETNALRIASVGMTSKTDDNILDQRYKEEAEAIEEEYRKELDELEREWEDESIDEKCVLFSENALWKKVSNSESPYFDLLRQRQTPYEVYGTDNKRTEETLCKEMIANAVRETLKDWEHLLFDCKKQFENTIQRIQSTENIQNDAIVCEMEKARDAYAFELEERTRQMTFQLLTEREISQNALCKHKETLESMREKELFPMIRHDAKTQKWIDEMMENTVKAESRRIAAELISGHGSEAMEVRDPSGFVEEEIRKLAATQREALREQQKEIHADAILRKERLRERIQKRVRTSEINEQVDAIDRIAEEENASLTTDCDAFLSNATKSLTEFVQQTISDVDGDIRNCIAMYDAEKDELALKLCEMRTERIRLYDANESDQMREEEETHKANAWEQLNASHKANLQSLHAKALSTAKEKKEQAQAQEIKAQEELDRIRSVHFFYLRERQQFDETLRIDEKNGENRLKQRIAEKRQRHKLKMNKIVVEENVKKEEMASAEEKETDEWKSQIATEQLLIDRIRWCQLERAKAEAMQRAIDTTFAIQWKGTNNAVEISFASTETKKKTFESILEEKKSPEEMEQLLRRCKDAHEQEAEKLRKELQSERQRQEHALKDRIRVRREKKMVSVLPIGIEDAKGSLEKEFQEQEQALEASIEANEAAAWSLIREKQQQDLRALTVKAQAIAQRKQQKANELEQFAAEELQRLSGEHVEESKQLEALLGSEKQRHEKRVQERVAQRRERKLSQLASVIEDGVSPRNEETFTSMEASAAMRIDTAKEAAERASFEAHKAIQIVDEMKAESLRAIEVERVAKEYAEKQSELKRSHYVDMMTQRKRLEARINAKKQRKLMDLDSKREKELLALSRSPISEKEKVSTHTMEADDLLLRFQAAKEAIDAIEWKRIPFDEAMRTECSDQRMESYLCTLERLMNGNIVPEKLSIELAIELILNPFHQSEVAAMYTKHKAEKKNVHRNMLKHLTEKRTEVRTRLLSQSTASEMEAILSDIDTLFHEKMKRLEAQVDEKMEVAHGIEFTEMRERHQSEVDFLRKHTNNRTVEWKTTSGDACQMSEACDAEKSVAVEIETLRVNVEREVEALEIAFGNEMKAQSDRWNALLETESEAFDSVWEKSNTNSADKKVQWKMMREKLCERQQFQITRLENRLQEEKQALWKAFAEKERLLRSEMTLKETTRDARPHIDSKASRDSFKEYQCHVHKELAKVCNHHTLHVKRIENSSFLIPTDFSKISHQLKESVQYFRFMVKSMTEDLTSLTLFEADTLANSTNLFYNPRERVVHVSSKFVETCDIGQSIVLLLFGVCRMESQIDEITDPKFISHCVELLIRSYQYMFDHRSFAVVPEHNQPRDCSTRWKSRAKEIQSFLVSLENSDVH